MGFAHLFTTAQKWRELRKSLKPFERGMNTVLAQVSILHINSV
jgi:hypothetical protein